jgi:hypothetical protein
MSKVPPPLLSQKDKTVNPRTKMFIYNGEGSNRMNIEGRVLFQELSTGLVFDVEHQDGVSAYQVAGTLRKSGEKVRFTREGVLYDPVSNKGKELLRNVVSYPNSVMKHYVDGRGSGTAKTSKPTTHKSGITISEPDLKEAMKKPGYVYYNFSYFEDRDKEPGIYSSGKLVKKCCEAWYYTFITPEGVRFLFYPHYISRSVAYGAYISDVSEGPQYEFGEFRLKFTRGEVADSEIPEKRRVPQVDDDFIRKYWDHQYNTRILEEYKKGNPRQYQHHKDLYDRLWKDITRKAKKNSPQRRRSPVPVKSKNSGASSSPSKNKSTSQSPNSPSQSVMIRRRRGRETGRVIQDSNSNNISPLPRKVGNKVRVSDERDFLIVEFRNGRVFGVPIDQIRNISNFINTT